MTNWIDLKLGRVLASINLMKKNSEHYCQAMTVYFGSNGKPLANLVMAISSYTQAKSVVEYSESPLYHYQYSSISKLFARLLESVGKDTGQFLKQVQDFIRPYVPKESIIRTQLDSFPVYKPLSYTHPERSTVYKPNVKVEGQKPVEIGYNISSFNRSGEPSRICRQMESSPFDETSIYERNLPSSRHSTDTSIYQKIADSTPISGQYC